MADVTRTPTEKEAAEFLQRISPQIVQLIAALLAYQRDTGWAVAPELFVEWKSSLSEDGTTVEHKLGRVEVVPGFLSLDPGQHLRGIRAG